jgi:hypothetical protein
MAFSLGCSIGLAIASPMMVLQSRPVQRDVLLIPIGNFDYEHASGATSAWSRAFRHAAGPRTLLCKMTDPLSQDFRRVIRSTLLNAAAEDSG